ncbi:hypothetical protein BH10BDE1_BH10BDE1_32110 [soil metagenome]
MDVKHSVRSILSPTLGKISETKLRDSVRGDGTTSADRDPNGQQEKEGEPQGRNLSEEEIQEAIKILEALPGVKDNGLQFKLSHDDDGIPVVRVHDRDGKIVRRISETELSQVKSRQTGGTVKTTGNILNKAM